VPEFEAAGLADRRGRLLGLQHLPEVPVQITPAGRERLERERARLQALAGG
jgi:hypothetical protein